MKKLTVTLATLLFSISSYAQIVEIEDNNFKSYLIGLGIDTDGDGEIQNSEAEAVTTLHIEDSGATSVVGIQSFSNLVAFSSIDHEISTIDVSNMSKLESISIDGWGYQLIAQNCTSLHSISEFEDIAEFELLDLTGCIALINLDFQTYVIGRNIILKYCSNLESINIQDSGLLIQNINLTGCTSLSVIDILTPLDQLIVSGLSSLETINTGWVGYLECINMPNLLRLTVANPGSAGELIINNCPLINHIELEFFEIENIEIDNFPELETFIFTGAGLTQNLSITNCTKLVNIELDPGPVNTLDLSGCTSITELDFGNYGFFPIENLILKNCSSITNLNFNDLIINMDLSGMVSLINITMFDSPEIINLGGCYNLKSFNVLGLTWSRILDFSSCPKLEEVNLAGAYDLETLILKNGSKETLQIQEAFTLSEICVDPNEILEIQTLIGTLGLMDVNVTTNCEFTNAGLPFQITGKAILDINGDDCATSSQTLPYTKYSITDTQGGEGYFFANSEGDYRFYLPEGNYTYKPEVLYGDDLFTTTPVEGSVSFPADGAEVIQDFCFTPGIPVDIIEVTLIPLEPARPGFDTRYLITYTNTGNVTRGGDIKLDFQDDRMDLIDATPMLDVQEEGFLSWAFEDLIPYETRSIEFTMNLNSPMETPALNGGDILEFEAMVGPLGNQTVSAYWSNLNQEIVNSFDPNDKTCLDGDILEPSMVGDFVKYMIRFENTGSAEAVNIVVTDSIDGSKFDIRTLEVLNSSHNVAVDIEGSVVDFVFKDIYLPFEDATNDGYVTFKIKTWDDLVLGDDLRNKAEIYFDFNFPIITNTTSTLVMDPLSIKEHLVSDITNEISPNPAADFIDIMSSENISKVEIFSISGRLLDVLAFAENKSERRISLQNLNSGQYFLKINNQNRHSIEKVIKL